MAYKILMVEDDSSIAAGLSYALEKEGYLVTGRTDPGDLSDCGG